MNDTYSQCILDECLKLGLIKEPNPETDDQQAVKYFHMVARQGFVMAFAKLSECLINGVSIGKDVSLGRGFRTP